MSIVLHTKITARRAVELGCSTGKTGELFKKAMGIEHYTGIELDKASAAEARQRLDTVHETDLQRVEPAELGITGEIDLLLALDVLEHLIDPWDVLARWIAVLRPGGHAVMSIPNIQHFSILVNLANGQFKYEKAGLLDATHLRFFTLQSVRELFEGAGLAEVMIAPRFEPNLDPQELLPQGNTFNMHNLQISDLSREQMMLIYTYQFMVIARKP